MRLQPKAPYLGLLPAELGQQSDTVLTITLGSSPTVVDNSEFTFSGLTDDAGNGTNPTDLVFSVDIT